MSEERLEAYRNLIQALLNCSSGEEAEILNANQDWIDAEFFQSMRQVAATTDESIKLLLQLLRAPLDSEDYENYQRIIVSLLEVNVDKLNDDFAQLVRSWTKITLYRSTPKQALLIASALYVLGYSIRDFSKGNKANNLEIAAACFKNSLRVYTREDFPEIWAELQDGLASVYFYRVHGDRLENLKQAIKYCENALEVLTPEANPEGWKKVQANLELIHSKIQEEEFIAKLTKKGEVGEFSIFEGPEFNLLIPTSSQLASRYTTTRKSKTDFLLEVLQAVEDSKGDREVVYPLLEANLDQLDENFAQALRKWEISIPKLKPEEARSIATVIGWLSSLIQEFSLGIKNSNLEIAINGYEVVLTVFTQASFPIEWAITQYNLGNAYLDRVTGEHRENLETAIHCYRKALEVLTPDGFPIDWAKATYNLGYACWKRIEGERSENQEEAIRCYSATLAVYTRDAFPKDWAEIQNNLGVAYSERIKGDRRENLEEAIRFHNLALEEFTRESHPIDWAKVVDNLGNAYAERIQGNRRENLEEAICCFKYALEERTRERSPKEWADTLNNFGLTYCDRIEGDRRENLEEAIDCFTAAREVFTREDFPFEWASAQNNQGLAYLYYQAEGDRRENLEKAIGCFTAALEVRTRERFPFEWAQTHNNLGLAYYNRIEGKPQDNLKEAIHSYKEALKEHTQEYFPVEWANTLNNLGLTYCDRIEGDRRVNLDEAIQCFFDALTESAWERFPFGWARTQYYQGRAYSFKGETTLAVECYQRALEIHTPTDSPIECFNAARLLGHTAFDAELWNTAIEGYRTAVEAVEQSRAWASTDRRKQQTLARVIEVYDRIVQAWINIGRIDKALEYVERSKARNLVELVASRDYYPKGTTPEVCEQLDQFRRELRRAQQQLDIEETRLASGIIARDERLNPASDIYITNRDRLNQLRQQLDRFIEDKIQPIDPSFSFTQKVEPISFSQIQSLLDANTAILEWYIAKGKFLTFIIHPKSPTPILWESSVEDYKSLWTWYRDYFTTYFNDKIKWQQDLTLLLQCLTEILHLPELLCHIPASCNQVILVPHLFLHLLPLHALAVENQESTVDSYLLDRFPRGVRYAPSSQLLQKAQSRIRLNFSHLFAIQNPTQDLDCSNLELQVIPQYFHSKDILVEKEAKKEAIKGLRLINAHCVHFSCHSYYNLENPLLSAIILADCQLSSSPSNTNRPQDSPLEKGIIIDLDKCLTLADLFTQDLSNCRLITLSACETALTDFRPASDEYIGLPSGFLVAGSPTIVSSLWTVEEFSTALLLIKFYENLQNHSNSGCMGMVIKAFNAFMKPLQQILCKRQRYGAIAVALNQAQKWLRDTTVQELLDWTEKLTKQLNLDKNFKQEVEEELNLFNIDEKPFSSPFYWAAYCAIGQ